MPHKKYSFSFLIFLFVLFNFSSGCSRPVLKAEKEEIPAEENNKLVEEQKKEEENNILSEKHSAAINEGTNNKDKLDEITGQINIYTAKERVARIRGNNEEVDDYKKKADEAKAVLEKMQRELPPDITAEQLSVTKPKSEIIKNKEEINYSNSIVYENIAEPLESRYNRTDAEMHYKKDASTPQISASDKEKVYETREERQIKKSVPYLKGAPSGNKDYYALESFDKDEERTPSESKAHFAPDVSYDEGVLEYFSDEIPMPVINPIKAPTSEKSIPLKKVYSYGSGLKAGYSDDNKQFNYFVDYLNKFQNVEHYPINIGERIVLKVKDLSGNSLPNAEVNIFSNNNLISNGLTYSDGSFTFYPSEYLSNLWQYNAVIEYMQVKKEIIIKRSGKREIDVKLDYQKNAKENTPIDILFIFDVTGSMKEEIDRLKASIELIKLNIASISSKPEVRFGMVLYRDRRDEFVTRIIPLTKDLNVFQEELNKVKTAGGGDGPEDLQMALKDSIQHIEWNKDGIRLSFVITDAPPHLDYGQKYTYVSAAKDAKDKGIKIFSIGTGGLDPMGEYVLRQLSQYTSAKYIFLTYGEKGESEGGMPGSVSHHTGSNYETDKLEAIIIKIAKEELSNFTDQPIDEGEDYFIASKIESEKKEETLKKLFDMAASQLIDYSTYSIEDKTPAAILSIKTKETEQNTNAEYFTEQLMLSLTKNSKFKMVERKDLQSVAKELELSLSGFTDEKNAVKVGQFIGAKILIYGEMYNKDDNFELFLKLVRVETGEILSVTKLKINFNLGV